MRAAELCPLLFLATERYLGNSNKYWPSEWLPRWRKDRRVASPEILGCTTALLLLTEDCGHIWQPAGKRRWTYQDGRHRARPPWTRASAASPSP